MREGFIGVGTEIAAQFEAEYQRQLAREEAQRTAEAEMLRLRAEKETGTASQNASLQYEKERRAAERALWREATAAHMKEFLTLYNRAKGIIAVVGIEEKSGIVFDQSRWFTSRPVIVAQEETLVQAVRVVTADQRKYLVRRDPMFVGHESTYWDRRLPVYSAKSERGLGLMLSDEDGTFQQAADEVAQQIELYDELFTVIENQIH